jgi:hypothetical protein
MNPFHFFATARERESIRRKRLAGEPPPWTDDPIFRAHRFTNVHRENDKTTAWFREHVREPLNRACKLYRESSAFPDHKYHQARIKLVESTIAFRWFNLISTGEVIQDLLIGKWDSDEARRRLRDKKPVVTGAFMIHSPYGYNKLDGLLRAIDWARPKLPAMVTKLWPTQQAAHEDLCTLDNMGSFSAGEVVWDLRHTAILDNATDINSWTNAGPGCARGLGYLVSDSPDLFSYGSRGDQVKMLELMIELLEVSKNPEYWPTEWEPWELHEVEMWLCEYAKYRSAMVGGRLKRRYP